MRLLLDHNVNSRYGRLLPGHEVSHTYKMGWEELLNGELITAAETAGFEVIITADKNLQYQQNLSGRKISIIVLNARGITWQHIEPLAPQVRAALEELTPGSFITIIPARQG
jgi:predicted nuclease of predicted toxin-antitoxin system